MLHFEVFNEYLNFHRSCAFPTEVEDKKKKGKIRKICRHKDYLTPYEKLKSLPDAKSYLKAGMTFEALDKIVLRKSDNQMAEEVQMRRYKLFSNIFSPGERKYNFL